MVERLELGPPSLVKQSLEFLGIREVRPKDLCPGGREEALEILYRLFPDLAGDQSSLDGNCQSWRGERGWWRGFLKAVRVDPANPSVRAAADALWEQVSLNQPQILGAEKMIRPNGEVCWYNPGTKRWETIGRI